MKKVLDTKHCSIKQMENMTYNLREKLEEYCSIGCDTSVNAHFYVGRGIMEDEVIAQKMYYIYVDPKHTYFEFWGELQQHYHKLVKGGN